MTTTPKTHATKLHIAFFILWLSLLIVFASVPNQTMASCGGTTNAANQTQLNAAIATFNSQSGPCQFTIALVSNINLTASTTQINNSAANVNLLINGNGLTVNGQNNPGIRPFTIAIDTPVTMQNITITGGNLAIDAAEDTGLSTDQRGNPRPQGMADDIGAFEFGHKIFLPLILAN